MRTPLRLIGSGVGSGGGGVRRRGRHGSVRGGGEGERVHKRMRARISVCARVEGRVRGVVHKRMRARISVCARVVVGCVFGPAEAAGMGEVGGVFVACSQRAKAKS